MRKLIVSIFVLGAIASAIMAPAASAAPREVYVENLKSA